MTVSPNRKGKSLPNITLPETNITHENPIFLGKYHQNGGFSMAMLVYRRVFFKGRTVKLQEGNSNLRPESCQVIAIEVCRERSPQMVVIVREMSQNVTWGF